MARGRVISASELATRLDEVAVLEISATPDDADFRRAHVPGAQFAYWKALLWDSLTRSFPAPTVTARRLGELGAARRPAVVYGSPVQYGTYALWALTAVGQQDVLVLDGGKEHWMAGDYPVSSTVSAPTATDDRAFGPEDRSTVIGRDDVRAAIGARGTTIIDFRTPEEYAGLRVSPPAMPGGFDHGAERAGHIPSARNIYYADLLNDDSTFKDRDGIHAVLQGHSVDINERVIAYCRLSHRATLGWVALSEIASAPRVQVYDGSWTEWGSMVGMPIAR